MENFHNSTTSTVGELFPEKLPDYFDAKYTIVIQLEPALQKFEY